MSNAFYTLIPVYSIIQHMIQDATLQNPLTVINGGPHFIASGLPIAEICILYPRDATSILRGV